MQVFKTERPRGHSDTGRPRPDRLSRRAAWFWPGVFQRSPEVRKREKNSHLGVSRWWVGLRSGSLFVGGQGLFLRLANKPPDLLMFPNTQKEASKQIFPKTPLLLSGQRKRKCHLRTRRIPHPSLWPLPCSISPPLDVTIALVTQEGGKQRRDPSWRREPKTSWIFKTSNSDFQGIRKLSLSSKESLTEVGVRLCIRPTKKGGAVTGGRSPGKPGSAF